MIPGGYEVKVNTHGAPQKVASGMVNVFDGFTGAKYDFIAYLGSKVVNGVNHAILAKQTLVAEKDVSSLVLLILNEKVGDVRGESFSIVEIRTLLSDAGLVGGYHIDPTTNIPEDIQKIFDNVFGGFFGATNKPFALVATQVANGMAYVFAVESSMQVSPTVMEKSNTRTISLIKIYGNYNKIETVAEVITGSVPGESSSVLLGASNSEGPQWP